jgi:hypothetical protein
MIILLTYFRQKETYFPTFIKNESEAYEIILLSVCLCHLPHQQLLNQLVDFHEIHHGDYVIEDDLDATLLIPQLQPLQNGRLNI